MGRESNASVGGIGLSLGLGQTKAAPEFGKRAVDSRRNGAYADCAVSSNAGRLAIRQSIYRGYSAVCIRRVKTLGLDEAELRSMITDPSTSGSRYQVLKKGISLEEKQTFEDYTEIDSEKEYTKTDLARRRCVQGVWFEEDYVRDYPLKTLASNVIGVGSNSGGASGLESYYTDVLDGTDGREFGYLDENSDLQRTIVEPTNGNTIVSTLDINIQQVVEKYIAEFDAEYGKDAEDGKGAKNIGVIVGNPQNGEIYAMASNHGFDLTDPDDLSDKYTDAELKSMTEEEKSDALNEKWYNYCVSESFEPGSTHGLYQ